MHVSQPTTWPHPLQTLPYPHSICLLWAHCWTPWKQIRRALLNVTISAASQKSITLLFTAHRLSRSCFRTVAWFCCEWQVRFCYRREGWSLLKQLKANSLLYTRKPHCCSFIPHRITWRFFFFTDHLCANSSGAELEFRFYRQLRCTNKVILVCNFCGHKFILDGQGHLSLSDARLT